MPLRLCAGHIPHQLQRRLTDHVSALLQGQHAAIVAVTTHHVPVTHSQTLKDPMGCVRTAGGDGDSGGLPSGLPPIGESGRSGSRMPPLLSDFLGLGGNKTPPQPGRTFARATDDRALFKWVRRRSKFVRLGLGIEIISLGLRVSVRVNDEQVCASARSTD